MSISTISHVIRGEDRLDDTAAQIEIVRGPWQRRAQLSPYSPLAAAGPGRRLGSVDLARSCVTPASSRYAVNSLLGRLGTADPIVPRLRLEELVIEFDLSRYDLVPPAFDPAGLEALNAALLQVMPFATVSHRLPQGAGAGFWEAVRPLLGRFGDVEIWWRLCPGSGYAAAGARGSVVCRRAAELLPAEPYDAGGCDKWLDRLRGAHRAQGRGGCLPLRRALTGRDDGPALRGLLPVIGRGRAHARLLGKIA